VSGELAFPVGKASPRGKIAFAVLPGEASFPTLLDTAFLVVVLWIVGAALAV
jgi:hypothetical protein